MTRLRPQSETPPLLGEPARRVILVGRTGLDQVLRKDQSCEIIRAATPLHAIGELGDPPLGLEEVPVVVLVGDAAESPDPAGTPAQFVAALRELRPDVLVIATAEAHEPEAFDAIVQPDDSLESLLACFKVTAPREHAAVEAGAGAPEESPANAAEHATVHIEQADVQSASQVDAATDPDPVLAPPEPEADLAADCMAAPAADAAPGPTETEELQLVERLLRGHTIQTSAIEQLLQRLGPGITWHEADAAAPEGPETPTRVAVRLGSEVAGYLHASDSAITPGRLTTAANWLAAWLRLERQHHELRLAAFTDPLTGAWNRRYFERFLEVSFQRAREARLPVTVMVFDIDHFKSYNDRFGHAAGDEILRETVRLLRSGIRPTDRVCRIGGDEFAVIFFEPGGPRAKGSAPPMSIYSIATRFQRQICAHRFPKLGESMHETLTISGGLATFPWDGTSPDELLRKADQLAMQSKQSGKNALTFGVGAERVCRVEFPEQP